MLHQLHQIISAARRARALAHDRAPGARPLGHTAPAPARAAARARLARPDGGAPCVSSHSTAASSCHAWREAPPRATSTPGPSWSAAWTASCGASPGATGSPPPTSTTSCRRPGCGRSTTSAACTTPGRSRAGSSSRRVARRCAPCSAACARSSPTTRRRSTIPIPPARTCCAIARERRAALHSAVERLSGRQRVLLTSMLSTPAPTYEQLSTRLEMPVGSIGPTRDRALARLRDDADLARAVAG